MLGTGGTWAWKEQIPSCIMVWLHRIGGEGNMGRRTSGVPWSVAVSPPALGEDYQLLLGVGLPHSSSRATL